ncbi:MAG: PorV/PorQ family protein [Candidatus Goldbacteria bacterium]|nr:PorV/PorQ family protein [Candidatus Goldiibacteriota bacterium]
MKRKIVFFIIILFIPLFLKATEVKSSAEIIFPVLNIGTSARAEGMSGAFTAVADDISAINLNPAGLVQIKNTQIGFSFNKWFMDSFISNIMAGINVGPGSIGFNIFYMNFGSFDKIESPETDVTGKINPFGFSTAFAYGINLSENFSAGLSLKFIMQSLLNKTDTGFAADLGLLYKISIFSLGLCTKNLGTGGIYSLPININPGIAFRILDSQFHTLIISTEYNLIMNSNQEIKAGIEYSFEKTIYLRTGYKYNLSDNYLTELKELSIGVGLSLGVMQINYAYVPYGELGTSHNIMLGLSFGGKPEKQPADKIAKPVKTVTPVPQKPKKTQEELYDMLATGGTYENSGKLDLAEQKYREILSYDEKYADAWKRLGAVLFKKKMVKEAIECFEIYIKLRPDDTAVKKWLEKHKK